MVRLRVCWRLAATGWVLISASLITNVMSPVRVQTLQDFIAHVVPGQGWSAICAMGWFWAASGC